MQSIRRHEFAGKSVSAFQSACQPEDACCGGRIGQSSQKKPARNACIAIHDRIEHIMNI
jgi:hypothetical protein